MNKTLLLVFFWAVCTTLCFGQSGTNLNRATRFAVLASTQVTNSGSTTITGDLGVSPGSTINDNGTLIVSGTRDLGNAAAAGAMTDAQAAYTALWTNTATPLTSPIGNSTTIRAGVYRISGDALLSGFLSLDARGNSNAKFIFLIDGDFSTEASSRILLVNGAQSQNIYWVVEGNSTVLGNRTTFHGSILSKGNITTNSVNLTGRLISLEGAVNLISSDILQPIQFEADLAITKSVAAGDYKIGDEVTYTLTATNNGPTNAVGVVVNETLPDGLVFVRANPANEYNATTGEWTIGGLSNQETTTLTLVFRVTKPGTLQNSVAISGDYNDPTQTNNTATATITATCVALPTIAITGNTEICDVDQTITYTATEVAGATYNFTLPQGWTLVSQQNNVLQVKVGVSGALSVRVTDQCNNTATGSLNVAVVAAPATPGINGDNLICDIAKTYTYNATGVTENLEFEWVAGGNFVIESGQGTASVVVRATGQGEGTLSLRVENICNVSATSALKTVKISALPAAPAITSTPENTEVCVGTTVTYNVASPVTGETYTWRVTGEIVLASGSDLTGNDISVVVNGPGALFVSATNECGVSATEGTLAITTITKPATPGPVEGTAQVCRGSVGNVYSVPAVAGATYDWTPPTGWTITAGNGTNSITATATEGAQAGNFTVTATNKCGTSDAATFAVTLKERPVAAVISGDPTACVSATPVTYSVTPVEGVTYVWSTQGDIAIDGANNTASVNIIVSGAGILTVTATNECAPTVTNLNINPTAKLAAPANLSSTATSEICEGQEITLTADAVTGADSYVWNIPADWRTVSTNITSNTLVVIANSTGTVTVAGVNKCGAGDVASLTVNVTAKPAAPIAINGDLTACVNTTTPVTYSIVAVTGATNYNWVATGDLEIVGSNQGLEVQVLVKGAGTLTVTSLNNTCEGGSRSISVTPSVVPAKPDAITGPAAVCRLSTTNTYSVPAVDGVIYNWEVPTGWSFTGEGTNTITATAGELAIAGNITVVAVNKCGNSEASTYAVTINEKPAAPAITGDATACVSTTPVTYAITAVAGETYAWTLSGDITIDGAATGAQVNVIVNGAGILTVTATNTCGATATNLNINPTPKLAAPANLRSSVTGEICGGQEITLTADAVAGATSYTWDIPAGVSVVSTDRTTNTLVVIANATSTVRVAANNKCGAGEFASLTVNVTAKPAAPTAINGDLTACVNTTTPVTYSIAAVTGATNYNWVATDGLEIVGSNQGLEVQVLVRSAGTLTVTSLTNTCEGGSRSISVTPSVIPTTPAAINGQTDVCVSTTPVTYSVDAAEGVTYTWRVTGGLAVASGTGLTGPSVSVVVSGTGSVFVKATNKCGDSAERELVITPTTTLAAPVNLRNNATGQICQGLRVTFNVDALAGADSYAWNLPTGWTADPASTSTQLIAIAGPSGTVSVAAVNKCGTGALATMNVTVTATPAAPVFATTNATPCINTSVTYAVNPVAGITNTWTITGDYTIGGDGDLVGDQITVTLRGPVTISVSGANGTCPGPATTLTVNPTTVPETPGTIAGPAEVCAGSTNNVYTIGEVAGATTYEWIVPAGWTFTGQGTRTITVTAGSANTTGGNILVRVNNACFTQMISSAPKAVTVAAAAGAAPAITDNSSLCDGLTYSIAAVPGATSYTWSVPSTGYTIIEGQGTTTIKVRRDNDRTAGTVTVTPVSALGCAGASSSIVINTAVLNGNLDFPKAFSPNNDGNNDKWVIANLEKFSENEVTIFNRYGSEVYKKKNYQNEWDGNGLEKGTYFYKVKVKFCDGVTKEFTGYTTIFR